MASQKMVSCSPTQLFVRSCCNKNSFANECVYIYKYINTYWNIHTNIIIHTSFHMGVPGSHGHPEDNYCCSASSWYEGTLPRSLRHLHHDPLHQSSPDSFCLCMAPSWPNRDVHWILLQSFPMPKRVWLPNPSGSRGLRKGAWSRGFQGPKWKFMFSWYNIICLNTWVCDLARGHVERRRDLFQLEQL